ncbi:enoyl-CoA hydratase/isomerase family protein [uncultured Pigmentiphaga sp.]|uniref:enoyl-CoA hydratase/isomerase family protein n=1 Tax=uncultured Pigmentiphaga sp. TaxID=340361 RepID=UPI0026183C63|nr:enoyl-CoA hydratase/isomerase family protein [uncultured Pigmentiphaga sp.]
MSTTDHVTSGQNFRYSVRDGWGHLQLERPEAGNRLDLETLSAITKLLHAESQHVGVLLISATGQDFCLGRERMEKSAAVSPFEAFKPVAAFYEALSGFPGLTISAVQGRAVGFGVGLVLRTDLCIAGDDASFTLEEILHDIPPMFVLAELVDHLPPKHLMEMIFTGRPVAAPEALAMGLISRTVPSVDLASTARDMAAAIAKSHTSLISACKQYIKQIRAVPQSSRLNVALSAQTLYSPEN